MTAALDLHDVGRPVHPSRGVGPAMPYNKDYVNYRKFVNALSPTIFSSLHQLTVMGSVRSCHKDSSSVGSPIRWCSPSCLAFAGHVVAAGHVPDSFLRLAFGALDDAPDRFAGSAVLLSHEFLLSGLGFSAELLAQCFRMSVMSSFFFFCE
jgi:hypothetical protein